jgi:hypothetical protein
MMREAIPSSTKFTCDCCRNEKIVEGTEVQFPPYWSILTLKRDAYDFQGSAVASATTMRHLCDLCTELVSNAINTVLEKRA